MLLETDPPHVESSVTTSTQGQPGAGMQWSLPRRERTQGDIHSDPSGRTSIDKTIKHELSPLLDRGFDAQPSISILELIAQPRITRSTTPKLLSAGLVYPEWKAVMNQMSSSTKIKDPNVVMYSPDMTEKEERAQRKALREKQIADKLALQNRVLNLLKPEDRAEYQLFLAQMKEKRRAKQLKFKAKKQARKQAKLAMQPTTVHRRAIWRNSVKVYDSSTDLVQDTVKQMAATETSTASDRRDEGKGFGFHSLGEITHIPGTRDTKRVDSHETEEDLMSGLLKTL
jgi:hypothetical protein